MINGGGGWGIFNALFGWTNSATYGSVISYNLYWVTVIIAFLAMRYNEVKGHWPLLKSKQPKPELRTDSETSSQNEGIMTETYTEKKDGALEEPSATRVRELRE